MMHASRSSHVKHGAAEWQDVGRFMRTDKLIMLVFAAGVVGAFIWSIRTEQGVRLFDRAGASAPAWYWLRLFRVPVTRENCGRFADRASWLGIVLVTVSAAVVIAFGQ